MARYRSRLLIVYNADGGILNALVHAVHKQFFPASYPCSLCALTYGAVSMRGEWRAFLRALPMDVVFHHRDDFAEAYPELHFALPAILIADHGELPRVLVPADELDAMNDTAALMERVEEKLVLERLRAPALRVVA